MERAAIVAVPYRGESAMRSEDSLIPYLKPEVQPGVVSIAESAVL